MSIDRDMKMGRALERIPLPELREGYYSELVVRLEQARPAPAQRPLRRARVFRVGMAAAAVAAAVAVAVVLFGLPGVHDTGPQPSLAAQVLAKMTSSLGDVRSFEADEVTVDYREAGTPVTTTSHIILDSAGDGRMEAEDGKYIVIHNTARGTQWSLARKGDHLVTEGVATGLPAGTVFSNIGDSAGAFMQRSYSTALRALLAARQNGMDVRSSTFDGRPAWTVKFAYDPANAVVIRLTIDQQTGLVFGSGQYKDGQPEWEYHVENVRLNQPLAPGSFRPPAGLHSGPPRAMPPQFDQGFKRVPLSRVERLVGYAPLVPARVPDGYTLADVTATAKSPGHVRGNSPRLVTSLVSMVYRQGMGSFTVALMPDEDGDMGLNDLSGGAVTGGDLSQTITLDGGALRGSRADIFIGLWAATAQIFVRGRGVPLNVMIRGDLTRDELVAVAESLQPYDGDR